MILSEVVDLCQLYEHLKTGNRNCKNINKVYKTIPNHKDKQTKSKKILEIQNYFEKLADDTLKSYLINKQISGDTQNGHR